MVARTVQALHCATRAAARHLRAPRLPRSALGDPRRGSAVTASSPWLADARSPGRDRRRPHQAGAGTREPASVLPGRCDRDVGVQGREKPAARPDGFPSQREHRGLVPGSPRQGTALRPAWTGQALRPEHPRRFPGHDYLRLLSQFTDTGRPVPPVGSRHACCCRGQCGLTSRS
jgi:hypothetical protein